MGTHHLGVQVAAPREQVFDLWIDLDRMKEWVGGNESARIAERDAALRSADSNAAR